ncbi:hypothetical protein AA0X95_20160 [Bacillus sp. 1P10SD]|uniref:hypothetical protein n=1 Tax=Bacillus sp. 1P10SD TaxID=3132265 RepID=UPI0039A6BF3C
MKKSDQRYWEKVSIGDTISPEEFPLTVARLVMAAGANRDFNSIHHNSEYAQQTGAPDMYANVIFLQGMWEKTVRNYIGLAGTIKSLKGFRMRVFNTVGEIVVTKGTVKKKWKEKDEYLVELEIWSETSKGISVGPGAVVVTLPFRKSV